MTEMPTTPPTDADAALAARLESLAARRAGAATPKAPASAAATATGAPGRTRRHPARNARLAAVGLTLFSTSGLTSFFLAAGAAPQQLSSATIVTTPVSAAGPSLPSTSVSSASAGTPPTTASPTSTTVPTATATATVVDGGVFRNRWGDVQVEVTFEPDGSIGDVVALRTPDHRFTSVRINDYAVPRLVAETIDIQSAQVHTISGATYTSHDYARSLQSAIDAARQAGITQLS